MSNTQSYFTIGKLKDELKRFDSDQKVYFEFGDFHPTAICSWRGCYDMPSLEYATKGEITVGQLLTNLELGTTLTYEGWKGGEYQFHNDQVLLVSELGCATSVVIVSIRDEETFFGGKRVVYLATKAINYAELD